MEETSVCPVPVHAVQRPVTVEHAPIESCFFLRVIEWYVGYGTIGSYSNNAALYHMVVFSQFLG